MQAATATKAVWMFHTQKDIDRYMILAYRFPCSFTIFIDLKIWTHTYYRSSDEFSKPDQSAFARFPGAVTQLIV